MTAVSETKRQSSGARPVDFSTGRALFMSFLLSWLPMECRRVRKGEVLGRRLLWRRNAEADMRKSRGKRERRRAERTSGEKSIASKCDKIF